MVTRALERRMECTGKRAVERRTVSSRDLVVEGRVRVVISEWPTTFSSIVSISPFWSLVIRLEKAEFYFRKMRRRRG